MNPVSLGLDGLLALLLVAALTVGARLNGKLKSLKDSQTAFVKAVADLDLAAGRAEAGLAALRAATEEAHDALLTRIETARTLSAKLDRASEDARTVVSRLEVASHRAERAAAAGPTAPAPPPPRLVDPVAASPEAAEPDRAALLRLIETARGEAQQSGLGGFGALHPPLASPRPTPTPASPDDLNPAADRLARFVARRRGARSA